MKFLKTLVAAIALALVGGCVAVPAEPGYYAPAYGYYTPYPYYYGPSVNFTYRGGGGHRH